MPNQPIDPLKSPRYALEGKVVTMDSKLAVLDEGVVYVDAGQIVAVEETDAPAPAGFEDAPLIRTGGTIYPGLIELHNHLSYNILPLWLVPKLFENRDRWKGHPEKRKLVTGPMQVLGKTPEYVPAIVRWVEAKCLVSGVTTSQGLALYGVGIQPFYRGITRNVEDTDDKALPEAKTRIADVEAKNAAKFLRRLERDSCLLLHLSEGGDEASRKHFKALHVKDDKWAVTPALAGIHCVPLTADDYRIMAERGGSMIWSPLSNLLLYGKTADVKAAKEAGVLMGLGSDWSPSGSKNLLCELKVARLVSEALGGVFTKQELLAMVTTDAAKILKWDKVLGSLEAGKRADLMVVRGRQGDPYDRLLEARETSVSLVVINGVPRCGERRLMEPFGPGTEELSIGQAERILNLAQETANPVVGELTVAKARERLTFGLQNLALLAAPLDDAAAPLTMLARTGRTFDDMSQALNALIAEGLAPQASADALAGFDPTTRPIVFLELDQDDLEGEYLRPHLPDPATGELTGFPLPVEAASVPYSKLLEDVRVRLDPLTLADDDQFFQLLARQPNLPDYIKAKLPPLYGVEPLADSAKFLPKVDEAVKPQFATTMELSTFMHTGGFLSLADRKEIVQQALLLLESVYVHLPLKRAMHAIDPIQRLKLLQYNLEQQTEDDLDPEMAFHNEMTDIFTSARDLHTNYLLPSPFREKTAFLPFMVEEYWEGGQPHYIVSKIVTGAETETFREGVEVLYWNGVPIQRAVALNADLQAGSNLDARHARGLDSLTIRPMVRVLPPDEEWVTIRYLDKGGHEQELTQKWLVFSPEAGPGGLDPDSSVAEAALLGFDLQTDAIHEVKKVLYAPKAVRDELKIAEARVASAVPPEGMDTIMPTVFRPKEVETQKGKFGYIRIFTFKVPDADAFVREFLRLVKTLPDNGLIVDVRGNGGGLIYAAERLLQVLTPHQIEPQRAQFINTPLTLEICRRHAPSTLWADFDLKPWIESIAQAVQTGATYSLGFPITLPLSCNTIGQQYYGPVVLITDALCYSATDIFAAGFQDHGIGPVLGTSGNTGAGGANVWTHRLLQMLMNDPDDPMTPRPDSPFQPLPHGADMRAAVRRTLRVGERAGIPVEDLGIVPDHEHDMTKDDLMHGNRDLIEKAGEILAELPSYKLAANVVGVDEEVIQLQITTQNLSQLDIYLDRRPQRSLDIEDGSRSIPLDLPHPLQSGDMMVLLLEGYEQDSMVARLRLEVRH
jgi:cytosine/adenosine deaminase-related metal-dependent hydrolase/C-terminal processing protease CtpA/Prc